MKSGKARWIGGKAVVSGDGVPTIGGRRQLVAAQ